MKKKLTVPAHKTSAAKDPNRYPKGLNRKKVEKIIGHYEKQTDEAAIAEDGTISTITEALTEASRWRKKLGGPLDDSTPLIREDRKR